MLAFIPHHSQHSGTSDFSFTYAYLGGVDNEVEAPLLAEMITRAKDFAFGFGIFRVSVIDNATTGEIVAQRPKNAKSTKDCDKGNDPVHTLYMGGTSANSSLGGHGQTATHRPIQPANSAHVSMSVQPARVSSPKRKDIPWLTTIFQNQRLTGPTAFRWTAVRERVALGLSLRASLSCLLCFTPSLAARACQQPKTQATSLPQQLKQFLRQLNKTQDHHSSQKAESTVCAFGFFAFVSHPQPEKMPC